MKVYRESFLNIQTNAEKLFPLFHNSFFNTVENHAPIRDMTNKERERALKPWITRSLLRKIDIRDSLFGKAIKTGDNHLLNRAKKLRNEIGHELKLSRKRYCINRINEAVNKSKIMWQIINGTLNCSKSKARSNISQVKDDEGKLILNPAEIANCFNKFFASVGRKMSNKIPNVENTIDSPNVTKSIVLSEATSSEIELLIDCMNLHKSTREDDIPIKLFKMSKSVISPFLASIFNKCVFQGVYPKLMKTAKVIPIYKKGDKDECSNYRPISLLLHANKIFEKLLHKRFYSFLQKHNVLNENQYGFRKSHSTSYAIYDLIEKS